MKLEQTKKRKRFRICLIEACLQIKSFRKLRNAYLDQASITDKKKYDQNISLVERQPESGRNSKLTELAEGFILGLIIANNTLKWGGIKEKLKQYFNIEIKKLQKKF